MKIGPVDTEMALLIVKKKKRRNYGREKYIARSAGLPSGLNNYLYTVLNSMTLPCTKYYQNWSMSVEDVANQTSVI